MQLFLVIMTGILPLPLNCPIKNVNTTLINAQLTQRDISRVHKTFAHHPPWTHPLSDNQRSPLKFWE